MRRWFLLIVILLPALACNLGSTAAPTPTAAPPPALSSPTLGLNPVVGAPGTVINVAAAGFPVGTRVNLFISFVTTPSTAPLTTLTIGAGGILSFALSLPDRINTTPLGNNTPLVFTLSAESGGAGANALFLALGTANATATPATGGDNGVTGGTGVANLFITAPAIGTYLAGGSVTVTGSGAASNNNVGVQIQDLNGTVLGSANASINAAAGYVGPWEVTVGFNQPAGQTTGYIVAYTNTQQASIPVTFAGSGVLPATAVPPLVFGTIPPAVRPVTTATPLGQ